MKIQQIKEIAKKHGVVAGKLSEQELIRSIQRAEGE
jgi:hypothetical protein